MKNERHLLLVGSEIRKPQDFQSEILPRYRKGNV